MVTTVEGVPVAHRRGTFRKGHEWQPRLGQVWLYDVRFAPKQLTRISHRYRVSSGQISDGTMLGYYVTRTGAPWAGTIGHARLRVHVPAESTYVEFETERSGLSVSKQLVEVDGKQMGELLLEARDWETRVDVAFSYRVLRGAPFMETWERAVSAADDAPRPGERCPSIVALMTRGEERGVPSAISQEDVEHFVREGIGDARTAATTSSLHTAGAFTMKPSTATSIRLASPATAGPITRSSRIRASRLRCWTAATGPP